MTRKKSRTFNFDFYYIKVSSNSNVKFEDLLKYVSNSPSDDNRNLERRDGDIIRLKNIEINSWRNCCEGNLIKIRRDNIPAEKINLLGITESLKLKEDEGLYEGSAFLYNQNLQILVFQRSKTAASDGDFVRYFKSKGGASCEIELQPLLKKDVLERLNKLAKIKQMIIQFKGPNNLDSLSTNANISNDQMLSLANELKAVNFTITASSGYKKEDHLSSKAINIVKDFFRSPPNNLEIKKMVIGGINEDDERDYLDLISERMTEKQTIKYREKHVTYDDARHALQKIWEENFLDLQSNYGNQ